MTLFQLIVLAIVQGVTEWLPISSSGHLILVPELFNWPDQGPLVDAMAHLGTLAALLVYFNKDAVSLVRGAFDVVLGKEVEGERVRITQDSKLLLLIALATPPGLFMGLLYAFTDFSDLVRDPRIIVFSLSGFGLALWAADTVGKRVKDFSQISWRDAALIGLAQALAFIPGTSRSGITMTMARLLGFERRDAARFGMLAGVPLFLMSGAYATLTVALEGAHAVAPDGTLIEITLMQAMTVLVFAFFAGWAAIWLLMNVVVRIGFLPFVIYRLGLAAFLAWVLFGPGAG
ncbi:MAG: undecaprenyl-diphosphate phosphatase [Maricaulaceae bacterium]|jgi:undecaprenyl-diphosphatase